MTATARHAALSALRENFLPARVTLPIMVVGTVAALTLGTAQTVTTQTAAPAPAQESTTSVVPLPTSTDTTHAWTVRFPGPSWWSAKLMCGGALRGHWVCGAPSGPRA